MFLGNTPIGFGLEFGCGFGLFLYLWVIFIACTFYFLSIFTSKAIQDYPILRLGIIYSSFQPLFSHLLVFPCQFCQNFVIKLDLVFFLEWWVFFFFCWGVLIWVLLDLVNSLRPLGEEGFLSTSFCSTERDLRCWGGSLFLFLWIWVFSFLLSFNVSFLVIKTFDLDAFNLGFWFVV